MKAFFYGIIFTILSGIAIGAVLISTGSVRVDAAGPETTFTRWLLHRAYEQRLAREEEGIQVPDDIGDRERVLAGALGFDQMCSDCHTPPGEQATVVNLGMNPPPPDLRDIPLARSAEQAFWVISNGVRMTGMPAFGLTHEDDELWDLVAFLEKARSLDGGAYRDMVEEARAASGAGDGHDHRHGGEEEGTAVRNDAADNGATEPSDGGKAPQESPPDHDHDHGDHDH